MKKKKMVELIKELMRLNNEATAVLIQLSVYLKEDKSETKIKTRVNTNKKNVIEQENVTTKRDKVELERRKMNDKPNPGSKEAIEQGCTCPMLDNYHGKGIPYPKGTAFWYHPDCPVHKEEEDVEE